MQLLIFLLLAVFHVDALTPLINAGIPTPVVQQQSTPAPVRHQLPNPTHRPAPAVHQQTPAPPRHYFNYLHSENGSLNTGVSYYSDCSGKTVLTHSSAAIYTCIHADLYFMGHNYGVFTPIMSMGVGSVIDYWDGSGNEHRYQVTSVRDFSYSNNPGVPAPLPGSAAQFQTCTTQSIVSPNFRVLDARAIG